MERGQSLVVTRCSDRPVIQPWWPCVPHPKGGRLLGAAASSMPSNSLEELGWGGHSSHLVSGYATPIPYFGCWRPPPENSPGNKTPVTVFISCRDCQRHPGVPSLPIPWPSRGSKLCAFLQHSGSPAVELDKASCPTWGHSQSLWGVLRRLWVWGKAAKWPFPEPRGASCFLQSLARDGVLIMFL